MYHILSITGKPLYLFCSNFTHLYESLFILLLGTLGQAHVVLKILCYSLDKVEASQNIVSNIFMFFTIVDFVVNCRVHSRIDGRSNVEQTKCIDWIAIQVCDLERTSLQLQLRSDHIFSKDIQGAWNIDIFLCG